VVVRSIRLGGLSSFLVCMLLSTLLPLAAGAITTREAERSRGGLDLLCESDCAMLDAPRDRGESEGFAFELGLEALADGLKLKVKSKKGNVYLVGPLDAIEPIKLKAGSGLKIAGAEDAVTRSGRNGVSMTYSVFGESVAATDPIDLASVIEGKKKPRKIKIGRKGDIYLDLSQVQLLKLKVRAKGAIISEHAAVPVPEPGTGLLVGAGLALLASRRRQHQGGA
jgi:hypothetical protein